MSEFYGADEQFNAWKRRVFERLTREEPYLVLDPERLATLTPQMMQVGHGLSGSLSYPSYHSDEAVAMVWLAMDALRPSEPPPALPQNPTAP